MKVRGAVKPKDARRIYKWGLLGFISNVGLFAGIIFIIRGLFQFKDKWLVFIGMGGILFTIGFWYTIEHSSFVERGNISASKILFNNLAKNIEFYKLQNGSYPDSLEEIRKQDKTVFIYDPSFHIGETAEKFNYHKQGRGYILFSSGLDRKPHTNDDLFPDSTFMDTTKNFGLIRR